MGLKNIAELQKEMDRLQGGAGGDKYIRMPASDGFVEIRVLPPLSGLVEDLYSFTRNHNINNQRVQCPNELVDGERWYGPCPICARGRKLWKMADETEDKDEKEALKSEAGSIKANERYFYVGVVKYQEGQFRGNKTNPIDVPLIWSIGKQVHEKFLTGLCGNKKYKEKSLGDVTAFDGEGRNFKVIKSTTKGRDGREFPEYDKSKFSDETTPAGTREQWEKWMANLPDLKAERCPASLDDCKLELAYHIGTLVDPRQGTDVADEDEIKEIQARRNASSGQRSSFVTGGYSPPSNLGGNSRTEADHQSAAMQSRRRPTESDDDCDVEPRKSSPAPARNLDTSRVEDQFLEGFE